MGGAAFAAATGRVQVQTSDAQRLLRVTRHREALLPSLTCTQEMDTRVEYDKAKSVKWLMAPGLIKISAEDIAAAHNDRNAREITKYPISQPSPNDLAFIFQFVHSLTPNPQKGGGSSR